MQINSLCVKSLVNKINNAEIVDAVEEVKLKADRTN